LLHTEAKADLAHIARDRHIDAASSDLPGLLSGPLAVYASQRAEELAGDHGRLRVAAGSAPRVSVEAVFPPDVIGLFTLIPGEV
jgi:hypothetical protein